jgi:hypothetical protein
LETIRMRKNGEILAIIGAIGVLGAYGWWKSFYGAVQAFLGANGPLPVECLYSTSGPCRIVANIAALAGVTPYDPLLFWSSAGVILIGVILSLGGGLINEQDEAYKKRRRDRIEPRL